LLVLGRERSEREERRVRRVRLALRMGLRVIWCYVEVRRWA